MPTCGACSISNRECVYGIEEDSSQTSKIKASPRTSVSSETPTNVSTSIVSKAESQVPSAAGPSSLSSYSSAAEASQPQTFVSRSEAYPRLCSRYSPDTIVSEQLLTADRASTKWLDLLATDAAQADSSFFLAPSPVPEDSVSNVGCEERRHSGVDSQTGPVARPLAKPAAERVFEKHAWQLDKDIVLQNREATLFRMFTERVALWVRWIFTRERGHRMADKVTLFTARLIRPLQTLLDIRCQVGSKYHVSSVVWSNIDLQSYEISV